MPLCLIEQGVRVFARAPRVMKQCLTGGRHVVSNERVSPRGRSR
jgi:hypothetical protein